MRATCVPVYVSGFRHRNISVLLASKIVFGVMFVISRQKNLNTENRSGRHRKEFSKHYGSKRRGATVSEKWTMLVAQKKTLERRENAHLQTPSAFCKEEQDLQAVWQLGNDQGVVSGSGELSWGLELAVWTSNLGCLLRSNSLSALRRSEWTVTRFIGWIVCHSTMFLPYYPWGGPELW